MQAFKGAIAEGVGDDGVGLVAQRESAGEELLDRPAKRLVAIIHRITSFFVSRHSGPSLTHGRPRLQFRPSGPPRAGFVNQSQRWAYWWVSDFARDPGYSETQMRLRSAQPLLVILVLTSYLLSLGGLPGASVLCYGADGHVAIEPAASKPCVSPSGDGLSSPETARGVADATSVSCFDIPISIKTDNVPASRSSEERSTVAKAVFLAVLYTHADISAPAARMFALSSVPFAASDSRAALRTIILLV
jgi:hypothetical protein